MRAQSYPALFLDGPGRAPLIACSADSRKPNPKLYSPQVLSSESSGTKVGTVSQGEWCLQRMPASNAPSRPV